MTYEELKAEAERQGYGLHKSMKGVCTCITGREWQLSHGRKKCLRYEWWRDTKNLTYCKRIETERSEDGQT